MDTTHSIPATVLSSSDSGPFGPSANHLSPLSWKTREDLLDRYNQHTTHCHSCSTALKNIRKYRPMVFTSSILMATLGKALLDYVLPGIV